MLRRYIKKIIKDEVQSCFWELKMIELRDRLINKKTITKKCSKCGKIKSSEHFNISRKSKTGLQSYCQDCQRAFYVSRVYNIGAQKVYEV